MTVCFLILFSGACRNWTIPPTGYSSLEAENKPRKRTTKARVEKSEEAEEETVETAEAEA